MINYAQFKLYNYILLSHYSLERLELWSVSITSDSARHLSHYIGTASQLKELALRDVRNRERR